MLETSVRLLRLLSLLQARPGWGGAELAERLDVTTRTVRNDVERLRILGYEIHSATGTAGGYRLGAGTAMPPLLLDDEEAVAVSVSLHAAASGSVTGIEETSLRALAKVQRMLPSRLRHRIEAMRAATVSVAGRGPTVDAGTLTTIAAAIRDRERLRFDYAGHDGTASLREVEPHRLVHTGRRWYLLAWDGDRDDWRTFRADRVRPRSPNGPRFTPRTPPGGDAAAHVMRGAASTAYRHPARVRLHAPAEAVADRIPPAAGLLTPLDPGDGAAGCLLETGSESLHDLAGFLGSLGVPFTVLEPPALRAHLRELAARYAAAADGPAADGAAADGPAEHAEPAEKAQEAPRRLSGI
ncbi:helix-turn-helix transcriptional regulator [Nonomuraea roseoviolacea]|uniref:DNA-binding transcriptional regulator YafY n=1 Tax=Nonomuraea roseoviolacea subsp. carminata TaxID=160689 RepID=A0ABT1KAK3_9ACTN|nr:YafY family protein [Nonomuraea roseoviolacea]MCP2351043.1 putative DNA-binding transcriptional regulator YafY [Nonomuraea roseoviolacea subsp. carminata]